MGTEFAARTKTDQRKIIIIKKKGRETVPNDG